MEVVDDAADVEDDDAVHMVGDGKSSALLDRSTPGLAFFFLDVDVAEAVAVVVVMTGAAAMVHNSFGCLDMFRVSRGDD